jgi:hypothetical protein
VKLGVSFTESSKIDVHNMEFYLAVYYLNGTLFDFKPLEDELFLCPNSLLD